ncbi:uncharacterized protein LOC101845778 [Aplysia californica]|uniref:Uncharacterized protein LOC101845778 n=1 Tax=Aplysia californica TaxID=6500 RepID=A0ABM1A2F6_APLCA|nr:uncharacterized protein LOC101845778 [Aplysia californica]
MTVPKMTLGQKAVKSAQVVERTLENRPVFAMLIIGTALLFASLLFLNFLSASPNMSHGLFNHSISGVSSMYPLNITPAGWAFSIWGVIYLLQLSWILYSLALICRQTPEGPAYLNPMVLSPAFFIFFSLSSAFNISWLFLWDQLLFLASFIFLACIAVSLYLTVTIAANRVVLYRENLIDNGRGCEVSFLQVAVVNGVSMYATWTTIATLINLGVVLVYKWSRPISNENASIICLGILAVIAVVYVGLDITVLERYTRYSVTPYLVVTWALSAIIAKNWDPKNASSIIAAVLLGAFGLASFMKVGLATYRGRSQAYQYRQMKAGRPRP